MSFLRIPQAGSTAVSKLTRAHPPLQLRKDGTDALLSRIVTRSSSRYLSSVQRLFSMFPSGTVGAALLVLRFSVAATSVVNGTAQWTPATSFWIPTASFLIAISLCLGLFTPYGSALAALLHLYILFTQAGSDPILLISSSVNSGVLAVLGPGAYSVDARLFGRRLLT